MKQQKKFVLYSGFGTSDPVRGMRDGGFLHILRHYRPAEIHLFLTQEIAELDHKDHRIEKTMTYVKNAWGGYLPRLFRHPFPIEDPSDLDCLEQPMYSVLEEILSQEPGREVLLNLSSGTPQMQIILSQMAMDTRYPTRGIQVKNPEHQAGTTDRTHVRYPVDDALELNEDEEPEAPNRCFQPQMLTLRRNNIRNLLDGLLQNRNYEAISQLGKDLPVPIPQLAKHLFLRSQFRLKEAEEVASGLPSMKLHPGKEELSYPDYELAEYWGILKNLVRLRDYTEFVLRLNPFLVRLELLRVSQYISPEDIFTKADGREKLDPAKLSRALPPLFSYLEKIMGTVEFRDISLRSLTAILEFYSDPAVPLLQSCQQLNQKLRNPAAHQLFSVSRTDILSTANMMPEQLAAALEDLTITTLCHQCPRYSNTRLKERMSVYQRGEAAIQKIFTNSSIELPR